MKPLVATSLFVSVLLLGFSLLDLSVVISQYYKSLGEPYPLYSRFGVRVVGSFMVLSCLGGWFVWRASKRMSKAWHNLALIQFILLLAAVAIFAFVFIGPFGEVRV